MKSFDFRAEHDTKINNNNCSDKLIIAVHMIFMYIQFLSESITSVDYFKIF